MQTEQKMTHTFILHSECATRTHASNVREKQCGSSIHAKWQNMQKENFNEKCIIMCFSGFTFSQLQHQHKLSLKLLAWDTVREQWYKAEICISLLASVQRVCFSYNVLTCVRVRSAARHKFFENFQFNCIHLEDKTIGNSALCEHKKVRQNQNALTFSFYSSLLLRVA